MIYIWVRGKIDWSDERAARARLWRGFGRKVDVWNEIFDMPYHRFRQRIREIAERSLEAVEGAAVAPAWEDVPDGALVLPVDDDDWFAPDAASVLEREARPEALVYRWTSSFFELPINRVHRLSLIRRRLFPRTKLYFSCTTNNYAVVKRPGAWKLADSHMLASTWVDHRPREVGVIDRRLSAMNRTLASYTSMAIGRPTVTRAECVRKLEGYRTLYRRPVPAGLEWCRPYLADMADLMEEVEVRT